MLVVVDIPPVEYISKVRLVPLYASIISDRGKEIDVTFMLLDNFQQISPVCSWQNINKLLLSPCRAPRRNYELWGTYYTECFLQAELLEFGLFGTRKHFVQVRYQLFGSFLRSLCQCAPSWTVYNFVSGFWTLSSVTVCTCVCVLSRTSPYCLNAYEVVAVIP